MRTAASIPVSQSPEASIPPEWQDELAQYPVDSYERRQFISTLGELGLAVPDIGLSPPGAEVSSLGAVPPGFTEWHVTDEKSRLLVSQFSGKVVALAVTSDEISTEVAELVSDADNIIRVCDLRPCMTGSLEKLGPRTSSEQGKLDRAFYRDLKTYADTGQIRNRVTDIAQGVYYSRAGGTSMRAFWTLAKDLNNPEGVPTVARLGDSGNNKGFEVQLYHRLFGATWRND